MKKKLLIITIVLASFFLMAAAGEASNAVKQIPIYYNDVKVTVDGKNISILPANEPFIYANSTFVPLRVVAEALKCNVTWKPDTKTVIITKSNAAASSSSSSDLTSLKSQLTARENEILSLKVQLAEKDKKIKDLEAKSGGDLGDLEDDLNDDYDKLGSVKIDNISLDGDEDETDVTIEVDLDDYDDEWEDLSDSRIKSFVSDIVSDIQDELSKNTEVTGEIINIGDDDEVLVDFSKDGTKSLDIDYDDDDYRSGDGNADDVIDDLEDEEYSVSSIDFDVNDATYYSSSDRVRVYCYASTNSADTLWSALSTSTKENRVEDICDDIADMFEDEDIDLETVQIYFYDDDDDLLDSYSYDVDDDSLN